VAAQVQRDITAVARENITIALREELQGQSDDGAGLAELLNHLHAANRRLSRGRRLTDDQLDELSLFCWSLQLNNPPGLLWGRARELWGGARQTRPGLRRHPRPAKASDKLG
jgi:hypothetical protein